MAFPPYVDGSNECNGWHLRPDDTYTPTHMEIDTHAHPIDRDRSIDRQSRERLNGRAKQQKHAAAAAREKTRSVVFSYFSLFRSFVRSIDARRRPSLSYGAAIPHDLPRACVCGPLLSLYAR